jgi:hypothetical protein
MRKMVYFGMTVLFERSEQASSITMSLAGEVMVMHKVHPEAEPSLKDLLAVICKINRDNHQAALDTKKHGSKTWVGAFRSVFSGKPSSVMISPDQVSTSKPPAGAYRSINIAKHYGRPDVVLMIIKCCAVIDHVDVTLAEAISLTVFVSLYHRIFGHMDIFSVSDSGWYRFMMGHPDPIVRGIIGSANGFWRALTNAAADQEDKPVPCDTANLSKIMTGSLSLRV